jgi:acyl-CoA dehydrogenase
VQAQGRKKGGAPASAARLAEATSLLQLMKANVVAALRRYEAALGIEDELATAGFAVAMNNLKTGTSQMAVQVISQALLVCGLSGYRNDTPYSLGRHLRDAHSAALMVNNDRILANTGSLLMAVRDAAGLLE